MQGRVLVRAGSEADSSRLAAPLAQDRFEFAQRVSVGIECVRLSCRERDRLPHCGGRADIDRRREQDCESKSRLGCSGMTSYSHGGFRMPVGPAANGW